MNTTVIHMNILSDPKKININLNFLIFNKIVADCQFLLGKLVTAFLFTSI